MKFNPLIVRLNKSGGGLSCTLEKILLLSMVIMSQFL